MKKIILFLILILFLGCQKGTGMKFPIDEFKNDIEDEVKAPDLDRVSEDPEFVGENEWSKALRDREKEISINDEQKNILANSYYEEGYKYYLELNYEKSKQRFRKTLELMPDHKNAKKYLNEIVALEGGYIPGDIENPVKDGM